MYSPTFWTKILFLIISGVIYYFFNRSYLFFSVFAAVSGIVLFIIFHRINRDHVIISSGILFLFPILLMAMDLRSRLKPEEKIIPEEFFQRKENGRLVAFPGSIQIKNMISPGIYLADLKIASKEVGYFPVKVIKKDEDSPGKEKKYYKKNFSRKNKKYNDQRSSYYNQNNIYRKNYDAANRKEYKTEKKSLQNLIWKTEKKYSDIDYGIVVFMKDAPIYEGCVFPVRLERKTGLLHLKDNSYGRYLHQQGGSASLYLKPHNLQDLDCGSMFLSGKFRKFICDIFERHKINGRVRDISLGIILGKASYLDREFKQISLELGIIHIFAASGLHLGILYFCLNVPLSFIFGKKHPIAVISPLPVCFMYLLVLSFPVSLLRAFIFLFLHGMKSIVHRRISLSTYLANSAILLFFVSPDEILSLSGILSFSAVAGILFFQKSVHELLYFYKGKVLNWFATQLSMSISAGIFVTPILIYVFYAHSFISIIFNIFAVPATSILMPLLFIGIVLECVPLLDILSKWVFLIASSGMEIFVMVVEMFSKISLYKKFNNWLVLPFYSSVIAIFIISFYFVLSEQNRRRYRGYFLMLLLLSLSITGPPGYFIFY